MHFSGEAEAGETRQYIAVVDSATGEARMVPAQAVRMQARVKAAEGIRNEDQRLDTAAGARDANQRLTKTFGGKQKRSAQEQRTAFQVDAGALAAGSKSTVGSAAAAAPRPRRRAHHDAPTGIRPRGLGAWKRRARAPASCRLTPTQVLEHDAGEADDDSARPVPAYDKRAATPREAYPLDESFTREERDCALTAVPHIAKMGAHFEAALPRAAGALTWPRRQAARASGFLR